MRGHRFLAGNPSDIQWQSQLSDLVTKHTQNFAPGQKKSCEIVNVKRNVVIIHPTGPLLGAATDSKSMNVVVAMFEL